MKVITVCGSLHFEKEMKAAARKLALEGNCVLLPLFPESGTDYSLEERKQLGAMHKEKISRSDGIFVCNVGGYMGSATREEIQLAQELGKEILYMEPLNEETVDRETIRSALQCRIYPLGYLKQYKYTVICSAYNEKWILSKHKKRDTWETQGGHIEEGETPLESARRELFEESGIQDADIYPVCDYWGFNSQACSNGMVFLAVVHSLGELPESEMKEIKIFDTLPDQLTYPLVSPRLYTEAEKILKGIKND